MNRTELSYNTLIPDISKQFNNKTEQTEIKTRASPYKRNVAGLGTRKLEKS